MVSSPSRPTFDIFTLHETYQGCLILRQHVAPLAHIISSTLLGQPKYSIARSKGPFVPNASAESSSHNLSSTSDFEDFESYLAAPMQSVLTPAPKLPNIPIDTRSSSLPYNIRGRTQSLSPITKESSNKRQSKTVDNNYGPPQNKRKKSIFNIEVSSTWEAYLNGFYDCCHNCDPLYSTKEQQAKSLYIELSEVDEWYTRKRRESSVGNSSQTITGDKDPSPRITNNITNSSGLMDSSPYIQPNQSSQKVTPRQAATRSLKPFPCIAAGCWARCESRSAWEKHE
ncbi:hypothetical protein NHQ30_010313 [Ciborinia camelliae]|nr:hypothetical protein NHQ30_010313 [Ciborinia camelliae]